MLITLFFTFLFVLLVALSFVTGILRNIIDGILSLFHRKDKQQQTTTVHKKTRQKKNKVFSESDGEYVDFEEIKK